MQAIKRLGLLSAMALAGACSTVNSRPCPRTTEFPTDLQREAAREIMQMPAGSALPRMMDAIAADRAFNRALCP
jgi:hypothetical protein